MCAPAGRGWKPWRAPATVWRAWRFALQIFEEGRFNPAGSIHVGCAEAYFETRELGDWLRKLCPELDESAHAQIALLLAPRLAKTEPADEKGERRSESG